MADRSWEDLRVCLTTADRPWVCPTRGARHAADHRPCSPTACLALSEGRKVAESKGPARAGRLAEDRPCPAVAPRRRRVYLTTADRSWEDLRVCLTTADRPWVCPTRGARHAADHRPCSPTACLALSEGRKLAESKGPARAGRLAEDRPCPAVAPRRRRVYLTMADRPWVYRTTADRRAAGPSCPARAGRLAEETASATVVSRAACLPSASRARAEARGRRARDRRGVDVSSCPCRSVRAGLCARLPGAIRDRAAGLP